MRLGRRPPGLRPTGPPGLRPSQMVPPGPGGITKGGRKALFVAAIVTSGTPPEGLPRAPQGLRRAEMGPKCPKSAKNGRNTVGVAPNDSNSTPEY